ncbi:MAG: glycosyltransferase family 39 protein [Microgenomates group bacterium]
MAKKVITILLFILICFRVGWTIYQHRDAYAPDYWMRYESLKNVYGQSQYTMKEWKSWIPDEIVYAYAAGAYLKGASPIIVEPTQPPLGKYLIGLSILIANNEHISIAFFFVFMLFGIYLLVLLMTNNRIMSLGAVLIASFERLFVDQLSFSPLLDMFFITFILYAVITASFALKKDKPFYLLLSYLFLGCAMMTKVWLIGIVFTAVITLYILLKKPKYFWYVVGGGGIILITTLLVYIRMFMDGYSVIEVLKVQKWLYWYQNGKLNHLFTIWPLIFLNKWYVWWGEIPIIQDASWVISWPIVIGSGILTSLYAASSIVKKLDPAIQISALCIIVYSVFISLGQASARYLLPFLPICYSMMIWAIFSIAKQVVYKRHHIKRT